MEKNTKNYFIQLCNGMVVVPRTCELVTESLKDDSDYAAVVLTHSGTYPPLIVFMDKPLRYHNPEERNALLELCWEKLKRIQKNKNGFDGIAFADGEFFDADRLETVDYFDMLPLEEIYSEGLIIREV